MYLSKHQLESGRIQYKQTKMSSRELYKIKDFYSQNGIGTRKLTRQKIKSVIAKFLSFPWGGDPGSISGRAGMVPLSLVSWGLVKAAPFGTCGLGCNSSEIRAWTCSFSLCPPSLTNEHSTWHLVEAQLTFVESMNVQLLKHAPGPYFLSSRLPILQAKFCFSLPLTFSRGGEFLLWISPANISIYFMKNLSYKDSEISLQKFKEFIFSCKISHVISLYLCLWIISLRKVVTWQFSFLKACNTNKNTDWVFIRKPHLFKFKKTKGKWKNQDTSHVILLLRCLKNRVGISWIKWEYLSLMTHCS